MKKPTLILLCAFASLLTGCWEARHHTSRSLAVTFPAPAAQLNMHLLVNDEEVQGALKLIDGVLTSNGIVGDLKQQSPNERGLIASYAKYDAAGIRLTGAPDLYLKDGRLTVEFVEIGNRSGHLTAKIQKVFDLLLNELKGRYGANRVSSRRTDAD